MQSSEQRLALLHLLFYIHKNYSYLPKCTIIKSADHFLHTMYTLMSLTCEVPVRPIPYESPNQKVLTPIQTFFETVRFQIPSKLQFGTLNRDFVACLCPGMYQVKGIQSFNLRFLRGGIHSFFTKIPSHSCD